ncbi:MAG: AAA family ATPase [Chthonomonas sp.]|nr:AAA family ATPase [Chthonomonas sp.]
MFKFHFKRGLIFAVLGLLAGGVLAWFTPKIYEATAELLLGGAAVSNAQATLTPDVQRILNVGQADDPQTELQVVRSNSIFYQALRNVAQAKNQPELMNDFVRLYLMYDVLTPETRATATLEGSVATIRVHANDRDLAQEICAQVTEVYNDFRKTNAQNGLQNAIRYLSAQETASKKALSEAEEKYKQYAAEQAIVDITTSNASATGLEAKAFEKLQEYRALSEAADAEVASLEQQLNSMPENIDGSSTKQQSSKVASVESQLTLARQELERLRTRYFEDHPRVVEAARNTRALMAELEKAKGEDLTTVASSSSINPAYQTLQQSYITAKARADGFRRQVSGAEGFQNEVNERLRTLPTTEAQIRQLTRDLTLADSNYRRVKAQLDELRSRETNYARVATVINPARAFEQPVAPDVSKYLFIGTIAGLCVGLIYSFGVEAMRLRVHTSQQLSELTGLPVVATIPAMGRGKQKGLRFYSGEGGRPSESFRHMAFTFLAKEHALPRVVMFTGVGSVAGRTSAALQFAMALAAGGKKVILVDADPVRALATKAFEAEGRFGLSDLFDKRSLPGDGTETIMATPHANLAFLPTGTNALKSLTERSEEEVSAVLGQLRTGADIIVFDLPPCDMFADAARMAGDVDEVYMVVSANSTNYAQIPNGYELLTRAGAKEVSLVLTDASANDEPFANAQGYAKAT